MEERDTPTEFAITCVRRWAQPLRFQPSITAKICSPVAKAKNKKGSNKAQFSQPGVKERDWKFHVLFLCGDAASQKEIKSSSNSGRFLSKAKSFYRHQFNIGERARISDDGVAEENELDYCVEHLSTFIIVANKRTEQAHPKTSFLHLKSAFIVAAITFQVFVERGKAAMFVPWLAVAGDTGEDGKALEVPATLSTWRRNGFGHFLLILAIKFAGTQLPGGTKKKRRQGPDQLDIYLQCNPGENAAVIFYKGAGFRDITPTPNVDNGLSVMSKVARNLLAKQANPDALFHKPSADGGGLFSLMWLSTMTETFLAPSHSFVSDQTTAEVTKAFNDTALAKTGVPLGVEEGDHIWDDDEARRFPYAAFPYLPKVPHVGQCLQLPLTIQREQIDELMKGENRLLALAPRTFLRNPKPPRAHTLRGVMTAFTRANHAQYTPLTGACVELFLSLMLSDDRYDNDVFIVSMHVSSLMVELHAAQQKMLEDTQNQEKVDQVKGIIIEQLNGMLGLFSEESPCLSS